MDRILYITDNNQISLMSPPEFLKSEIYTKRLLLKPTKDDGKIQVEAEDDLKQVAKHMINEI